LAVLSSLAFRIHSAFHSIDIVYKVPVNGEGREKAGRAGRAVLVSDDLRKEKGNLVHEPHHLHIDFCLCDKQYTL